METKPPSQKQQINFRVPKELRKKFAIKCIEIERNEQDVLVEFIEKFLDEKPETETGTKTETGTGTGTGTKTETKPHDPGQQLPGGRGAHPEPPQKMSVK